MEFPEFVWVWMKLQNLSMPRLHLKMAKWLAGCWEAGERQLLLMAFRDSGKSTMVGLFCAWLLARNPDTRILVLAADHALSKKMVRNVKRIIERHPLTEGLKPRRRDQWASDQFTVNRKSELRDPSMLAKGIGANVTGSRADVVICDDVEVPNTCDTSSKRRDLRQRLLEIDYVLVPGGLQLYVGTPHTYETIYGEDPRPELDETVPFLDGFGRLELPVIDRDGRSAWSERFPLKKIEAMRKRSGPNKFDSQMMLRPVNLRDCRLDPDLMRPYDHELDFRDGNGEASLWIGAKRMVSASCWWDPSYGSPSGGDKSVLAAVFSDDEGGYWLHRVAYLSHDGANGEEAEAVQLCTKAAHVLQDLHVPSVTIETNGIGRFLPGLLRRELAKSGLSCAVVEKASVRNKDLRILDGFDARLAAGVLNVHRAVLNTPFVREMREWQPGANGADDGLDAVAGCLLSEPVRFGRLSRSNTTAPGRWMGRGASYSAQTDFKL